MVRCERQDGVAVIVIDNPPVNALCTAVSEGIAVALEQARKDSDDIHQLEQQAWGEASRRIRSAQDPQWSR
jgi:hypothetical protein